MEECLPPCEKKQDAKLYDFKYVKSTCDGVKTDFSPCPPRHPTPAPFPFQVTKATCFLVKLMMSRHPALTERRSVFSRADKVRVFDHRK